MDYRKLPHGEEEISVIGLGTSSIGAAGDKEIEAVMTLALEKGINYFDMASADLDMIKRSVDWQLNALKTDYRTFFPYAQRGVRGIGFRDFGYADVQYQSCL